MRELPIKQLLGILGSIAIALGVGYYWGSYAHPQRNEASHSPHVHAKPVSQAQSWTCSMHPQIRQEAPGSCPICGMDLIPLGETSSGDPFVLEMTPEAVKLANIETGIVGSVGSAQKELTLSGKIAVDERLTASQVAHIPGRIEQLYVTFTGEPIRKGQKLATLYAPELITAQRELLEALKFKDVNADLLRAARKKLQSWKITPEQISQIEKSAQIQETFVVYADASGVVARRSVAVGDYVQQGQMLFELIGLDRVWVFFDAYEEDLASIQVGDRMSFSTPALPGKTFATRIDFIDPVINPSTRVAILRGELDNPGNALKPEMFVRGTLQAQSLAPGQLQVPKSAVLWTGLRSVVYVKDSEAPIPSFQFREVELGERVGDYYLVASGLEPGEEVVTYGNFTLDAAAQLNNQASMMNRHVSVKGSKDKSELPDYVASTPITFKRELNKVVEAYLTLTDALVDSNPVEAQAGARRLLDKLSGVDMSLITDQARLFWMDQLGALQAHGEQIAALADVEAQRKQFDFLSQALINAIRVFGTPRNTFYVQHCPMAFDNTGADWISDEEEIRNPYFGDVMLTCGLVQETISQDTLSSTTDIDP